MVAVLIILNRIFNLINTTRIPCGRVSCRENCQLMTFTMFLQNQRNLKIKLLHFQLSLSTFKNRFQRLPFTLIILNTLLLCSCFVIEDFCAKSKYYYWALHKPKGFLGSCYYDKRAKSRSEHSWWKKMVLKKSLANFFVVVCWLFCVFPPSQNLAKCKSWYVC